MAQSIRARVPAELTELLDAVGSAENLLKLIEAHGGRRIPVPRVASADTKLARELGMTVAEGLAAWRGGEDIKVPLAKNWRIKVYREAGYSYTKIAATLGIGESAVHKHLQLAGMTGKKRPAPATRRATVDA